MQTRTKTWFTLASAIFLAQTVPGFAQQSNPGADERPPGWRKVGDPPPAATRPPEAFPQEATPFPQDAPPQEAPPPDDQARAGQPPYQQQPTAPPIMNSQLLLPAGSWITVRVNQPISTDHNQPGDAFTATLAQPLVAEGRVIARRGQMVAGRVVDVQKGGRVKGTARLAIELTELSLVDGQQVPIRTQFTDRGADTSVGRDAGAIAAGTGVGAAIGAAADGGFGAGMGAIAGAAASTIGVLATRGNNAAVYPENLLTFRLEAPVVISTARSEQAFQPVTQDAYEPRQGYGYRNDQPPPRQGARYYAGPAYGYGYGYGGYYPPYPGYYAPYYGSGLFFSVGPRFYGRGYGYGYGRGGFGRGGGYRRR